MAKNKWNMFDAEAKSPEKKHSKSCGKWGGLMEEHNTKTDE